MNGIKFIRKAGKSFRKDFSQYIQDIGYHLNVSTYIEQDKNKKEKYSLLARICYTEDINENIKRNIENTIPNTYTFKRKNINVILEYFWQIRI